MEIFKNNINNYNLKEFEKISDNVFVNENYGMLLEFYDNGYIIKKTSYLISDMKSSNIPLREHSYNNLPSLVRYNNEGLVESLKYSIMGKLHSVNGNYILLKNGDVAYWLNGVKNTKNIKEIFDYFNLVYNKNNADLLGDVISVFYKSPDNVGSFLDALKSIDVKSWNMESDELKLLDMIYY